MGRRGITLSAVFSLVRLVGSSVEAPAVRDLQGSSGPALPPHWYAIVSHRV